MTHASQSSASAGVMEAILQETTASPLEDGEALVIRNLNNISVPLARNMLHKIGLDSNCKQPFHLADIGCGMGVVAPLLKDMISRDVLDNSKVLG